MRKMKGLAYFLVWVVLAVFIFIDFTRHKRRISSNDALPYARVLQSVLHLSTRIFRGQGVSAAVIVEGQGYWAGASGYSHPGKPIIPEMGFNIGSIGKNFLAALILQLAEEGRLSLDDPIARWDSGASTHDKSITLRQLLNHTSGIFDWVTHPQSPFYIPYRQIDHARVWSQEEVLTLLTGRPYFSPGAGWHYSTTNYNLLRVIAEEVTHTPVAVEIRRRFLAPLGLENTLVMEAVSPVPAGCEIAHSWLDVDGDGRLEDISADSQAWIASMSPAMLYASAMDLARWSQALYGGQVLRPASLEQMLDFYRPIHDEPPLTGYGLGTAEISIKGLPKSYGHLGWHYGNMSAMLYFPRLKASLVVLTNQNHQPYQYAAAFGLLAVILLGQARHFLYALVWLILGLEWWKKAKRLPPPPNS